jgi:hypothetical protein
MASIAAGAGFFGVIVGSVVSGYFQLASQRITAEQSEHLAQYETSRAAAREITKNAADWLTEVSALTVAARTSGNLPDIDGRMKALTRAGLELSLQTSLPTAQKILNANVYVSELLAARGSAEKLKALEPRASSLGEAYVAVYSDVARYRFTSGPSMAQDELITSFLQMLAASPVKK